MCKLTFSLADYQDGLRANHYTPPETLCPYYDVDPVLFGYLANSGLRRDGLNKAFSELRKRTGQKYFNATYPLQSRTLDYSSRAFPAYRFILPEVMSEDWLAIVDWGKYQRDHVLHQPLCGYIVLKLLGDTAGENPFCTSDGTPLIDACVNQILRWSGTRYIRDFLVSCGMADGDPILDGSMPRTRAIWRAFFREAAYIAAIFHDLGYPWQYAERIQSNLMGMNSPAVARNRSAAQIIDQFGHRLLIHAMRGYHRQDAASPSCWDERVLKITDAALSQTHGFPGALGFLHLNDALRRYPSKVQSPLRLLCIEWVAVAIMMHDMSRIYWGKGRSDGRTPDNPSLGVSFDHDPLSAIVTLADVLQEFQRPSASFKELSSPITEPQVGITYGTACSKTELELDGTAMTIRYSMIDHNSRSVKRRAITEDQRIYFDPRHGFLSMNSIGVDSVNLQAV